MLFSISSTSVLLPNKLGSVELNWNVGKVYAKRHELLWHRVLHRFCAVPRKKKRILSPIWVVQGRHYRCWAGYVLIITSSCSRGLCSVPLLVGLSGGSKGLGLGTGGSMHTPLPLPGLNNAVPLLPLVWIISRAFLWTDLVGLLSLHRSTIHTQPLIHEGRASVRPPQNQRRGP